MIETFDTLTLLASAALLVWVLLILILAFWIDWGTKKRDPWEFDKWITPGTVDDWDGWEERNQDRPVRWEV